MRWRRTDGRHRSAANCLIRPVTPTNAVSTPPDNTTTASMESSVRNHVPPAFEATTDSTLLDEATMVGRSTTPGRAFGRGKMSVNQHIQSY